VSAGRVASAYQKPLLSFAGAVESISDFQCENSRQLSSFEEGRRFPKLVVRASRAVRITTGLIEAKPINIKLATATSFYKPGAFVSDELIAAPELIIAMSFHNL
jgi:hypothetical protein